MVDEEDLVDEGLGEMIGSGVLPVGFHDEHEDAGGVADQEADGGCQTENSHLTHRHCLAI